MSPKPWQEVADEIFGGGIDEIAPPVEEPRVWVYEEKRKREPKTLQDHWFAWQRAHPQYETASVLFVLSLPILMILIALMVGSIIGDISLAHTSCQDMLSWTIDKIPARCLAELSDMKK